MYEQVRQGDRDGISIDEEFLKNTLDKQASNDQKTTQIVSQTKTAISRRGRPRAGDHHTPDAITTGAALVLILATGSSTKPVDYPNIGSGCNLPVSRLHLQKATNRAALETKMGCFRTVARYMVNSK